jgi:hypothetical protein
MFVMAIVVSSTILPLKGQGLPIDWSSGHVVMGDAGFVSDAREANDPRVRLHSLMRGYRDSVESHHVKGRPLNTSPLSTGDWSATLNTTVASSGITQDRFPAKFGFNPAAAPDCTFDFVVLGLNVAGSFGPGGQANLVGFNNLYTNPGGTGFCGGTAPVVAWAFNVGAAPIPNSVVLSLDGSKVAYVLNQSPPTLEVVTLGTGGGTITSPQAIGANGSSVLFLPLASATSVTNSSIFVDYANDIGYVGDDNGHLFKVSPLFGGQPALSGTWGTNPITAGTLKLTSPVFDFVNGVVMVGSQDGNLYGFNAADGTAMTNSPMSLAVNCSAIPIGGPCANGILAPPVLDVANKFAYLGYAADVVTTSVSAAAQVAYSVPGGGAPPTFEAPASVKRIALGQGDQIDISKGAFNDLYFASGTNTDWLYFTCGTTDSGGASTHLYAIQFDASRRFSGRLDWSPLSGANGRCSPLTEVPNPFTRSGAITHDYLLFSLPVSQVVLSFDVLTLNAPVSVLVPGGTSGIIIDNDSGSPEASSAYFTSLSADPSCGTTICVYKKHQGDLQ